MGRRQRKDDGPRRRARLRRGADGPISRFPRDLTIEPGYEAARHAALHGLGLAKFALGDLDRVSQALQLIGYVNSAPGFSDQSRVVNGAADLLVELYGEPGMPTRAAIGCHGLAANNSVEIVPTLVFSGTEVRPPLARVPIAKPG